MPRDPKARRGRGRGAREAPGDGTAGAVEWRTPRKWKRAESVEDWRKKELERLNCTKYHYLKFVEKQKVERRLKSCKRQLVQAQEAGKKEEVGALQKQLRSHLADHEYITYYPKHLPYNSLFPAQDSEASQQRRAEIRRMIREQLAQEGTEAALDALGDESQVASKKKGEVQRKASKVKPGQQQQQQQPPQPQLKKKKKLKQREELQEEPLAESPVGETGMTLKRKPKKRRVEAQPSEKPAKVEKEAASRKKPLKHPKRKAQQVEEPSAKPAKTAKTKSSKGSKSSTAADGDGGLHPSWNAKKTAKVSGALVQAAGDRKVFESDSDA